MTVGPDNFGLQKSARLEALRRERDEGKKVAPLEPEFPWTLLPFPASFFGAAASNFDNRDEVEKL